MFDLTCEITIGKYIFRQAHQVVIRSGRDILTSTANIKLANAQSFIGDTSILDRAISVGDAVEIKLGYDGTNHVEFTGYVAEKRPNVPFEIICEDETWKLKQTTITKVYPSVGLMELLRDIVPGIVTSGVYQATLTDFRLNKATPLQVLSEIKNTYGLDVYARNGKIYCGLPYNSGGRRIKYHLQDTTIKNNLVFLQPGDIKIKVRAISLQTDNTYIEVDAGDSDGNTTTLHFSRLTKEELVRAAEEKVKLLKIKGYKGSVVTWGIPFAKHGDIGVWLDDFYPARQQANFIDQVVTEWGVNGFRRTLTPGNKTTVAA